MWQFRWRSALEIGDGVGTIFGRFGFRRLPRGFLACLIAAPAASAAAATACTATAAPRIIARKCAVWLCFGWGHSYGWNCCSGLNRDCGRLRAFKSRWLAHCLRPLGRTCLAALLEIGLRTILRSGLWA